MEHLWAPAAPQWPFFIKESAPSPAVVSHPNEHGPCLPASFATAARPADLLTRAGGMVVVTGQTKVSDAMSSSDAEDDSQEPATPTATQAEHALSLLPQQVSELVPFALWLLQFSGAAAGMVLSLEASPE